MDCGSIFLLLLFLLPPLWPFAFLYVSYKLLRWLFTSSQSTDGGRPDTVAGTPVATQPSYDGKYLINARDQKLCTYHWPAAGGAEQARAVIIISHGYAEHAGRYEYVAKELTKQGFAVLALDHHGHGLSEGNPRTYTDDLSKYVDDLHAFSEAALQFHLYDTTSRFLLGHSMGGLIAATHASIHADYWDGVLLAGPSFALPQANALTERIVSTAVDYLPHLTLTKLDPQGICTDPMVVKAYLADPLVYSGPARASTILSMIRYGHQCIAHPGNFPFILAYGTDDAVIDTAGCTQFYANSSSTDKAIRPFPDMRHEILNEPDKDIVIRLFVDWINERIG